MSLKHFTFMSMILLALLYVCVYGDADSTNCLTNNKMGKEAGFRHFSNIKVRQLEQFMLCYG